MAAVSSSSMLSVSSSVVPGRTRASGIVPKDSLTLSPSSSMSSWVTVNVKDLEVSPLPKVTLGGTPE